MTDRDQTRRDAEVLVSELHEALNDPKRGEWGGYPWEHLGDAERDVRVLLAGFSALLAELEQAERERDEAREDVARCAADTTAAELAQEVECLKAELRAQRGYKMDALARLATVPALVEALRGMVEPDPHTDGYAELAAAREALAVWEQE